MSKVMKNNRIAWKELVRHYPNSWVILENAKVVNDEVISGELVNVCHDSDIFQRVKELAPSLSGKVVAQRTTTPIRGFGPHVMKLNLYGKHCAANVG